MSDKVSERDCIICWEKIEDENIYITECIHCYDLHCIYGWIMSNNKSNHLCPMCQTPLNKENIISLYNAKYKLNIIIDDILYDQMYHIGSDIALSTNNNNYNNNNPPDNSSLCAYLLDCFKPTLIRQSDNNLPHAPLNSSTSRVMI